MTRINAAIPVVCLSDEHLLAEHREIKRLPYNLKMSVQSGSIKNIPKNFVLGQGHVLFFLDKMKFIYNRYIQLNIECNKRGLKVEDYSENWDGIPIGYFNDYYPTEECFELLVDRITERILNSNKEYFHYYRKPISKTSAINLLTLYKI